MPREPSAGRGRETRAVITALCARQDKAVCRGANGGGGGASSEGV